MFSRLYSTMSNIKMCDIDNKPDGHVIYIIHDDNCSNIIVKELDEICIVHKNVLNIIFYVYSIEFLNKMFVFLNKYHNTLYRVQIIIDIDNKKLDAEMDINGKYFLVPLLVIKINNCSDIIRKTIYKFMDCYELIITDDFAPQNPPITIRSKHIMSVCSSDAYLNYDIPELRIMHIYGNCYPYINVSKIVEMKCYFVNNNAFIKKLAGSLCISKIDFCGMFEDPDEYEKNKLLFINNKNSIFDCNEYYFKSEICKKIKIPQIHDDILKYCINRFL